MEKEGKKDSKAKFVEFNDAKCLMKKIAIKNFSNKDFLSLSLPKNKDLIPGKYEGGIKIWECSLDLCNFLPFYIGDYPLENLNVLDLGCGHGLPGLYFLLRKSNVLFNDFNEEVLEKITSSYINEILVEYQNLTENYALLSGDWKEFNEKIEKKCFILKKRLLF